MALFKQIKRVISETIVVFDRYEKQQNDDIWMVPYPKQLSDLTKEYERLCKELNYWLDHYYFISGEANQQGRWDICSDYSNRVDQIEAQFVQIENLIPHRLRFILPLF